MCDKINLTGKSFIELLALLLCDINNDDDFYDVISYNLAKYYPRQFEVILGDLSGKRLRGAICGIGMAKGNSQCIIQYITADDEYMVSAAIDALRRIGRFDVWSDIHPLLEHHSPYVRGAALRFVRAMSADDARPILLAALQDQSDIVRQNALDELDGVVSEDDRNKIEPFLSDKSSAVRMAAKNLLDSLGS